MGKKSKTQSKDVAQSSKTDASLPFLSGSASIDPTLASLFEQSAGPVKTPVQTFIPQSKDEGEDEENDEELSELEEDSAIEDDEDMQDAPEDASELDSTPVLETQAASSKKRKRVAAEEVEETYMRRIAKEEQKEEEKRRAEKAKRQKVEEEKDAEKSADESADDDEESSEDEEEITVPKHESQGGDKASTELEKSNRTVFLGNVSNEAIKSKSGKKTLLKHLASFLSTLPESTGPHKVESIRFRSVAFASGGKVPKRADFARRDVLDDTTPSTNAYAVYSTIQAARKAPAALNGTVVLDRHLRVDSIAHPSPVDNKRCVFVGNLDFVDNETNPDDDEKKKKKRSVPADVEEGLWRTFNVQTKGSKDKSSSRGNVESVRVVRDPITRVGKGFAYVQFYDANCVEQALLLDGKKFPPMLPRKLRVTRAKKISKKRDGPETSARDRKLGEAFTTLQGRAGKLFGKAGASQFKAGERRSVAQNSVVFEGHRATEGSASRIKVKTKSRGSKGKPKNRSAKRAAAYQAAGGRKGKIAANAAK
ncbi:rRNA-processing protein NOP12 [Aspergillus clavatus NRRL 1]|uniref:Nucleolar protein 12 n=1 Tax=Aspergillus clavatus (strain ATCC 1007 / CBS 513.65 / DSM 816 / NCTC 3887 / NRRL 1 / QM 1276 / 107) TaxID=344612 RepID=A1C3Y0_ASPCL|nr:RNA binding protein, putative [Aspergillus clavatus NRRL 1]EAW15120.1 RNA binding protein, putative [Aspergillus clavatus NRRL 1]